jgi:cytochrome c biogenesis protein CcmG/thiol:disulfide interchange protein DsbE
MPEVPGRELVLSAAMSSRLAVALGLIVGAALVIAAAIAIVLMTPGLTGRIPPTPSPAAASPSGGVSASPSGAVSASPAATGGSPAAGSPSAATSPGSGTSPTAAPAAFHVGQPAPPLSLPQIGGGTADLAALRGRPVWVYFMATWCPSCQEEFPVMNGFAARYAKDGLVVLAVDVRESEATAAAFATRMNATFPVGVDGNGTAATTWGVVGLPVHFWIDAQGIVRDGALGGIGADQMAGGLRTVMPGVAISP